MFWTTPENNKRIHARLVNTPKPVNTLSSLRLFHDTVENHIRGLTALQQSENSYGTLLVPIILGKFPPEIQRNQACVHTDPEWTITDLQESIMTELRVLESGESLECTSESLENTLSTMTTTSLFTGTRKFKQRTQPPKPARCTYCNSMDHSSFACNTVTDPKRRMEIVCKGNLCFNCLGHHRIAQCRSKAWCKHCRGKHHLAYVRLQQTSITKR